MAELDHVHHMQVANLPIDHVLHARCECGFVREYPSNYDDLQAVSNRRKGVPMHFTPMSNRLPRRQDYKRSHHAKRPKEISKTWNSFK